MRRDIFTILLIRRANCKPTPIIKQSLCQKDILTQKKTKSAKKAEK